MDFYIDRHSGRRDGKFHNVFSSDNADEAIAEYKKRSAALRQGTVRLWDNGQIILATSAPRLRSRW